MPPLIKSSPLDIDLDTGFYQREEYFQVTRHPGCLQQAPCLQAAAPVKILKPSINDSLVVIKICQIAAKSVRKRYAGAKVHLEEVLHVGSSSYDLLSALWTQQRI